MIHALHHYRMSIKRGTNIKSFLNLNVMDKNIKLKVEQW